MVFQKFTAGRNEQNKCKNQEASRSRFTDYRRKDVFRSYLDVSMKNQNMEKV